PAASLEHFRYWADSALKSTLIEDSDKIRSDLAYKYSAWIERFLKHGPACFAPTLETGFSLGTVTEQMVWRMPPDRHGKVSFFIKVASEWGSSRKFVVR